ncbi:hypothetical protein, partial [Pantoea sp. GbtcB22]|uniref:hypothetical protein n=1 Tax=Pantoea sp. GbtcB22 TaxID=2824767 RepID=UPI001C2F40BF
YLGGNAGIYKPIVYLHAGRCIIGQVANISSKIPAGFQTPLCQMLMSLTLIDPERPLKRFTGGF